LRISVKGIIKNDKNKLLLVQERADHWSYPGGGIEEGERTIDAVKREIFEETGYTATVGEIAFVQDLTFTDGVRQIELFFVGKIDETIPLSPKHELPYCFVDETKFNEIICLPKNIRPFDKLKTIDFQQVVL